MSGFAWVLSALRLTGGHVSVSEVDRVMNNSESAANAKQHLEARCDITSQRS